MIVNSQPHYMAQANASFWIRPRNPALSREISSYSLARLNEIYHLNAKSKADAVRHILYDGGFCYDGVLPESALQGDPQFAQCYDASGAITRFSVMMDHLKIGVKAHGYDCTGRRQKSLYLQALAGNKTARKSLDDFYHKPFPSHPKAAWEAIEQILHEVYDAYLRQIGCPNRLRTHPMYPTISPPLPNPVRLRGFILRARKARDIDTLSWMLGRDVAPDELLAENAEHLVQSILTHFGYTSTEITAMKNIVLQQKTKPPNIHASRKSESGGFLLGCTVLFASIAFGFGGLFLATWMMKKLDAVGNIIGIAVCCAVLVFYGLLCRIFRGKKGRPP